MKYSGTAGHLARKRLRTPLLVLVTSFALVAGLLAGTATPAHAVTPNTARPASSTPTGSGGHTSVSASAGEMSAKGGKPTASTSKASVSPTTSASTGKETTSSPSGTGAVKMGTVKAPARTAATTSPQAGYVNPGTDFTLTMPLIEGETVADANNVISTVIPGWLGIPAGSSLSTMVNALYHEQTAGTPLGAGGAPPPSTFAGTITATTVNGVPSIVISVPSSQMPASDPTGTAQQGAETNGEAAIIGLVQFAIMAVAGGGCWYFLQSAYVGLAAPPWRSTVCTMLVGVAAGYASFAMGRLYGQNAGPVGTELRLQASYLATSALLPGVALLLIQYPNAVPFLYLFLKERMAPIGAAIKNGWNTVSAWFSSLFSASSAGSATDLLGSYLDDMVAQATTATMNGVFQPAGLPSVVAEGDVSDSVINKSSFAECMDVYGANGSPVAGQSVGINDCSSSSADQGWVQWSNGYLTNGGLCLDQGGAGFTHTLILNVCYRTVVTSPAGGLTQIFKQGYQLFTGKPLVYEGRWGDCVDDPNWNTDPGTQLRTRWCTVTTAQQWVLPAGLAVNATGTYPIVTDYGPVESGVSGECMDSYGGTDATASPGQVVAVNGCNGNEAQQWAVGSDNSIQVWGLCLDSSGSSAGSPVGLESCSGASSQTWTANSSGELVQGGSGLCLEDPGATATAGTQLTVDTCSGAADQKWTLPPAVPAETPPPTGSSGGVCDIYETGGTPCVAAYSMTRAMYASYNGPLYQVTRSSDSTTQDIGLLAQGGDVNASEQDSFCANTTCLVTKIYDQSPNGNSLTVEGVGTQGGPDTPSVADALPIKIGGANNIKAYGLDITPGNGYRDDGPNNAGAIGVAKNGAPEGMYMVSSGTYYNAGCCFDFGNAETGNNDTGQGHMDAVNLTSYCANNNQPSSCGGSGPWVEADMENGQWTGAGVNVEPASGSSFVTAMLSNDGQNSFELQGGDSESGGLTTFYNGSLPSGYVHHMQQEGGIVLGTGGDNSQGDEGAFFEGVMTSGFPTAATSAAVQANIVAAGYSGSTIPNPDAVAPPPSAAGQAVVHSTGATGAGAAGFSSVFTVDSGTGDLQESYLPYMGDSWTSQDLSSAALAGTPQVMAGTKPVSILHCGYTSVFTVDAANGDLEETYLAAIGGKWVSHDLSALYQTPPTNTTPTVVEHTTGASDATPGCGYTSVYTVDRNGDLEETYLPNTGFPGDPWIHQDLSTSYQDTPQVLPGTSPVAITHCGYTSVFTVDSNTHDLQETYLAAIGGPWATHDLTVDYQTPPTDATPTAAEHNTGAPGATSDCGYTSVYTVNQGTQDLEETYLPNTGFPGAPWVHQDLSTIYGTPPVAPGTAPQALVHMGYTSVYTVDQGSGDLEESYLAAIPGGWSRQDLSSVYKTPPTDQSPIVLEHPDASGNIDWTSVFTVNEFNTDLGETYLSNVGFPGDGWVYQDLSTKYSTPSVAASDSANPASASVDHLGFTSMYTSNANSGNDLMESYLPAMGEGWNTQDLADSYLAPQVSPGSTPVALFHDGYTSVFTVEKLHGSKNGSDLMESYLPDAGFPGDAWHTQDLSTSYQSPPVDQGTSPSAVLHDGYVSVFTIDGSGDLWETYLPSAGFPGDAWHSQDLSTGYQTPRAMPGTSPVAIEHDGFVSVYTVDENGDLQETWLPFLGDAWSTHDLTTTYQTPQTKVTPTVVFHDGFTSVYTVDENGDLEESYLPYMDAAWAHQDLTSKYGVPQALNIAPAALYHDGFTSVFYITGPNDDVEEAFLPAISGPWNSHDLTALYQTPPSVQTPSPLLHYDVNGGLTWTSVFTTGASNSHLEEAYLSDAGFPGNAWTSQDLTTKYQAPSVQPPGSVVYAPSSSSEYLGYNRTIKLQNSGTANGELLSTFEHETGTGSYADYVIQQSDDNGASWSTISTLPSGNVKALAPFLYEFPTQLGNYPAGTLMLLGDTRNANDLDAQIPEWTSTNHGASWSYVTTVQGSAGGPGDGVWEPFVMLDGSGNLAMFFSDERQNSTYSQFIGEVLSNDGGQTWSAYADGSTRWGPGEIKVVASTFQADRPGMPTAVQMGPGGQYIMSYEMCGPQACSVHTKTSSDGDNWGSSPSDLGTVAATSSGLSLQVSPVITWVAAQGANPATLYLTAHKDVSSSGGLPANQTVILTNTNSGSGPWSWIPAPTIPTVGANSVCALDYSPDLTLDPDGGALLYTTAEAAGPYGCEEVTVRTPIAHWAAKI